MANCNDCRLAAWSRENEGRCGWKMPEIKLPTAFFYPGRGGLSTPPPPPAGGTIRRDMPFNHCPCWKGGA